MNPRPYQQTAIDALYRYFEVHQGNPVLEAPTAAGKSVIQSCFIKRALEEWPDQRILCLTHSKELVFQNYQAMRRAWPRGDIGINSASLGQRNTGNRVIFAGIQSVYKLAHELGWFDLVMIDECHLCPVRTADGMYRTFLDDLRKYNPRLKVVGFSATPYRLDNGLLIEGENRLFTDLIPAKACGMSIDDLLAAGYLCPLTTKPVQTRLAVDGVPIRGGEYVLKDLQAAVDVDSVTKAAVDETIALGADRDAWLIFASSVEHAEHIASYLDHRWISNRIITGNTPDGERDESIAAYRRGDVRALVNVNVLTTGFDAPHTDLLAFLRPTMSASLYVQMAGRGMRIHPGKRDCLVLDFAGLIAKHGPVNDVDPPRKRGQKEGQAPIKECSSCLMLIHASARECLYCGEKFEAGRGINISGEASTLDVLSSKAPEKIAPTEWAFSIHKKYGKPDSLRVDYYSGPLRVATEWVCLFHDGRVKYRAEAWWCEHVGSALPADIDQAIELAEEKARMPSYIYTQKEGKYTRIVSRGFNGVAA